MAQVCDLCGKRPVSGNRVSHANNKRKRTFSPNLHSVRAQVGKGTGKGKGVRRIRVCTRCIRSGKVTKVA